MSKTQAIEEIRKLIIQLDLVIASAISSDDNEKPHAEALLGKIEKVIKEAQK